MKFIGPQWQAQASGGESSSSDSCIVVSPTQPTDLENGLWIESDLVDKKINIVNSGGDTSTDKFTIDYLTSFSYNANGDCIVINNVVYIFGGDSCNKIQKYDILTNTVSISNTTLPVGYPFVILGNVENKIYIAYSSIYRCIYNINDDTISNIDMTFDLNPSIGQVYYRTVGTYIYVMIRYYFYKIDTNSNIVTLITTGPSNKNVLGMTKNTKTHCIYIHIYYSGYVDFSYCYDYVNNSISTINRPFYNDCNDLSIAQGSNNIVPSLKYIPHNKYMLQYICKYDSSGFLCYYHIYKLTNYCFEKIISTYDISPSYLNYPYINIPNTGYRLYSISTNTNTHITDDGCMYLFGPPIYNTSASSNQTINCSPYIFKINYLGKLLQDQNFLDMYSDSIIVSIDIDSDNRNPHKSNYVPLYKYGDTLKYEKIRRCLYINNNIVKLLKIHKISNYQVVEYLNQYVDQ